MAPAPTGLPRIGRDPDLDESPSVASATLAGPALAAVVRIVELQLRQVPLDTMTVEALPAMLALFDAPAGALLLYRREDASLTLAAARGLTVAGAEALDVLRWGDEETSEMPLRALVDRRIYIVAEPDEDPFIGRLLGTDRRRPIASVAAVPLYRWHLPVGVLLVLGSGAPLATDALTAPAFVYSVLSLALSTLMWTRDERGPTPLPAPEMAPPPLGCAPWVDRRERQDVDQGRRSPDVARAEDRSALEAMLQELRAVVTRMDEERRETARERSMLGERLASFEEEHRRLAAELATTEQDRSLLASRLACLEEMLATKLAATAITPPPPEPERVAAPVAAPPPAETKAAPEAPPAGAATTDGPALGSVLEPDATLRDRIRDAVTKAIPAGRGAVTAVNLVACDSTRVVEMAAANANGTMLVGYASHPERGSRILGPLRCFVAPPSAAEIAATVDSAGRGNRRTILLTEDIDGFMAAKAALVKAGHSVSMACDEKQALDLLAILRPDTVVIDVRNAGQPAVEFLDALGPENGRVLTVIVHGDPGGGTLARIAERMMRPPALDVNELAKVCSQALPEAKRQGSAPGRR